MKLNPTNSNHQKSFYGKAVVAPVVGGEGLFSYGDLVAATGPDGEVKRVVSDNFMRLKGGWSNTTGEHLKAFFDYLGKTFIGKKAWMQLEPQAPHSFLA